MYPKQFFEKPDKKTMLLMFMALGVVYGDIGTSPLYAINEIFYGHEYKIVNNLSVIGPISLVVWAITIIIGLKYLSLVLRADNDGEGGVFALYAKLHQFKNKYIRYLKILLMLAAGLLIGEGIITPAISVLSAVEGIAIYNTALTDKIVLITLIILTTLFMIQSRGTNSLGKLFGFVALLWFMTIGFYGLLSVLETPAILSCFNPLNAYRFLSLINLHQALIILGSVMLVITGGEALFADMGHFGARPIRLGWFLIVYPSLVLSYLGQGAFLLSGKLILNKNIFFSLIPKMALFPVVILATLATIIASQALISGAFSLASQAVSLGLFPRLKIVHTHEDHEGQIYVSFINWFLFIGTVILVMVFKNSTSLAAAYGLSVSGVMITTTLAMMATAHLIWKWSSINIYIVFLPIFAIELTFLTSNSLKFFEGGFIPVVLGIMLFIVMRIWRWGRKAIFKAYIKSESLSIKEMINLKNNQSFYIDKNVVLLVPKPLRSIEDKAPALVSFFYNRYGLFPKNLFLIEVVHRKTPYIHDSRYESFVFYNDELKGTVTSTAIHFGFMENPNVEMVLEDLAKLHKIPLPADPNNWLVHCAVEKFITRPDLKLFALLRYKIFMFLRKVSEPAHFHYGLGNDVNLSIEIMPIKLD